MTETLNKSSKKISKKKTQLKERDVSCDEGPKKAMIEYKNSKEY
jgi:hypothetical protein